MFEGVSLGGEVDARPAQRPDKRNLEGRYVTLVPLAISHAHSLYQTLCEQSPISVFAYIPRGPFADEDSFTKYIEELITSREPLFFAVAPNQALPGIEAGNAVGYLSLMNIDPTHRTIEVGHITFSQALQRTTVATEALYLAMKYCMEDLGNRRLEWKCDALNVKSRRAADRLGFTYEGLFRKHRIVRGRNRDTAWFSIVDDEWDARANAIEIWLRLANFTDGKQVKSLEQVQEELGVSVSQRKIGSEGV
ncbi:gcn5-related n-acetyltransferase [Xylariales sp. AK1849]|nr:gcn5-related n-acetyltransferase [Xylariales sp. AK1849]